MRHDFLDRYSRLDSPIHRLPPALKVIAAIALVIAIVVVPAGHRFAFLGLTLALAALAALSRIPPLFILRRLVFLEPVVLIVGVITMFESHGQRGFLAVVIKCSLCLVTMILLANTTPFAQLLQVLRKARTPALLITTLALMYRYVFVVVDETQRMRRARQSRTFVRSRLATWKSLASIIGQLFIRSSQRAERIYAAMCARGWR